MAQVVFGEGSCAHGEAGVNIENVMLEGDVVHHYIELP